MYVVKRNGQRERVYFDKITQRIARLCGGLHGHYVVPERVAKRVIEGIYDGVTTQALDNLAAEVCASMTVLHPDYSKLAARLAVSNLHKLTNASFFNTAKALYEHVHPVTKRPTPLIAKAVYAIIKQNASLIDKTIDYDRDFTYDYFGFKTLERSYLLRIDDRVVERPQDMLMRVSIGIHGEDLHAAFETYHLMSKKRFTHATPTLFNAGTPKPQLSSCYLLTMQADSIEGIYSTLKQCAKISQSAGGIGLSIHTIRGKGSYISGTNGVSNGIVPMLRNFDMTARYVDQGGGKRKGSFAIYLEPWHVDIFDFLQLKKNHGKEEMRARDLFYALWICDLFMRRVEENGEWSLFCPNEAPGLADVWGEQFERLYERYEREGKERMRVKARDLWHKILEAQMETGVPYMLYKDSVNRKSNQQNVGTILSSNLCCEVVEYSSPQEVAVCNLASISLPAFVTERGAFNHQALYEVTRHITKNLNKVIDVNLYPIPEAERSNKRHRPIGIGVQGLADTFVLLRYPFESKEAAQLNVDIFETIYFAAMTASKDLAIKGGAYDSYEGSPLSEGKFQFDLWGVSPTSGRWDWPSLREEVKKYGARNALLVAPMPTASTSNVLGNNECFEPFTSNLYTRRVLSGEFIVVNKYLLHDLIRLGLWNEKMKDKIIANNGSVQAIEIIPHEIRMLYKTVWEIPQRIVLDLSIGRAPYICQSQSLNVHMANPTFDKMTSLHFYAWKNGLKTGMYYLRSKPAANPIQFTLNKAARQRETTSDAVEKSSQVGPALNEQRHDTPENGKQMPIISPPACSLDDEYCEPCGA